MFDSPIEWLDLEIINIAVWILCVSVSTSGDISISVYQVLEVSVLDFLLPVNSYYIFGPAVFLEDD